MRYTAGNLPLILVAKDDVAVLHHLEEHIMRFQSVSPKILTVVDIADNSQAIRYRQFDGIHGRFHRITADGTSNTRAVEYSRISQNLIPFHHIPFQ